MVALQSEGSPRPSCRQLFEGLTTPAIDTSRTPTLHWVTITLRPDGQSDAPRGWRDKGVSRGPLGRTKNGLGRRTYPDPYPDTGTGYVLSWDTQP